eukprot:14708034-Alexandrium_andersonii.AAC.1
MSAATERAMTTVPAPLAGVGPARGRGHATAGRSEMSRRRRGAVALAATNVETAMRRLGATVAGQVAALEPRR